MAAMRAGIKTVIIPSDNEPDLEEIDKTVRRSLNFITTDNIDSILDVALDFSGVKSKGISPPVAAVLDKDNGIPNSGAVIKQ